MNKAVFLDRDGTINVDYGYVHEPEKFELLPGVEEGLRRLQEKGYLLIIVTNQSGIGRGYFTEQAYIEFQNYIDNYFKDKGIIITAQYYCPHIDTDNCSCRKPQTGLYEEAANEFKIDWEQSFVIGDRIRDLEICKKKNIMV